MGSARYSCPILMKPEFSRQFFRKIFKYKKFMKIRRVGAKVFHADRHDEANSRFSQLCEHA
jgi:hypothetical protein